MMKINKNEIKFRQNLGGEFYTRVFGALLLPLTHGILSQYICFVKS